MYVYQLFDSYILLFFRQADVHPNWNMKQKIYNQLKELRKSYLVLNVHNYKGFYNNFFLFYKILGPDKYYLSSSHITAINIDNDKKGAFYK